MISLTGQCSRCGIPMHRNGKVCKPCRSICPDCGGIKKGYNSQRCSSCATRDQWQNRGKKSGQIKLETNCIRCGISFYTTKYKLEKRNNRYCSLECKNPPLYVACQQCNKTFRDSPSNQSRYCSKKCAYSAQEKSDKAKYKALEQWSNPVSKQKLLEGIKLRSQSEEWKSAIHFQKGENHPKYKGNRASRREGMNNYEYRAWRCAVLKNANFTCQICKVRGGKLKAHHVKAWAEHPELRYEVSNGMSLCQSCHNQAHGKQARVKTYHCLVCGKQKTDGRQPRCRSCGAKKL